MKLLKKDLLIFFLITGIVVILAIKVCYIVVVLAINAFYMKVKAYGDKGVESDFSKKNEGCTFIGDQEESVRQEAWITASQGELSDAIIVAWKAMEGADAYKVYRSNNFYGPYFPVRHIIGEEKYIDKKADQGRYYWYKVKPLTSVYEGRPTKRAQGWIKPPETSESAHGSGVSGILGDIISLIPHWTGLSFLAQKYQKIMPYPMIIDEYIPTSEKIYEYVERVCATPHRRIGSPEGRLGEEYIIKTLGEIVGPENVKTDPVACFVYKVDNHGLKIETNQKIIDYDCFYVNNTGINDVKPNGGSVTGEMEWAGEGTPDEFSALGDLTGKIAVVECPVPNLPLPLIAMLIQNMYYVSDPNNELELSDKLTITALLKNLPHEYEGHENNQNSAYWLAYGAGAEGLIVILTNYPANVNTHWGPYGTKPFEKMPALFVDNYSREEIKSFAEQGVTASITIEGTITPGTARNIYSVLPGKSKETIMVTTHHDAAFKGATEDGTGVAMVMAMAKAWSRVPDEQREKTLLFVFSAGHFFGGKGAEVFAEEHKHDLLENAIVDINLEHLSARKVTEDENHNMVVDGDKGALELLFVTEDLTAIAASRRMLERHQPKRTACIPGTFLGPIPPGEAGHYHLVLGVEYIHYIGNPQYLLCGEDTLDKVDIPQLNPNAKGVSELIGSYMVLPDDYNAYDEFQ